MVNEAKAKFGGRQREWNTIHNTRFHGDLRIKVESAHDTFNHGFFERGLVSIRAGSADDGNSVSQIFSVLVPLRVSSLDDDSVKFETAVDVQLAIGHDEMTIKR